MAAGDGHLSSSTSGSCVYVKPAAGYTRISDVFCETADRTGTSYSTQADAQAACDIDPTCTMICKYKRNPHSNLLSRDVSENLIVVADDDSCDYDGVYLCTLADTTVAAGDGHLSSSTSGSCVFTKAGGSTAVGTCGGSDLASLHSPVDGSTRDSGDTYTTSCGGQGNEATYHIRLDPGQSIDIGMNDNTYDSRHETSWGGSCPGQNVVTCTDDPDTTRHQWTNDQGSAQTVFFVIDAYYSGSGTFTLSWTVSGGVNRQPWDGSGVTEDFENAGWNDGSGLFFTDPGSHHWTQASSGTPSGDTGAASAHGGQSYIFTEASSNFDTDFILNFVPMFPAGRSASVEIWYQMFGSGMGTLFLETAPGNDASVATGWTTVWSKTGQQQTSQSDPFLMDTATFQPTQDSVARIRGHTGADFHSDIAIDDVHLMLGAGAPPPQAPPGPQPPGSSPTAQPCANNPCLNNGVCSATTGAGLLYSCACAAGFSGSRCQSFLGCVNPSAMNYQWRALADDGSCTSFPDTVLAATRAVRQEVCLEYSQQHHPSWSYSTGTCPDLPGIAWPTDDLAHIVGGATTPCSELPTIEQVCERAGESVFNWVQHGESCSGGERYESRSEAETACVMEPSCTGIKDPGCDATGAHYLCTNSVSAWSTSSSYCSIAKMTAVGTSSISPTDRATEWLNLAHDYVMQTADQNAAVIARQLCDEDALEAVLCVKMAPQEHASLRMVTNQACVLADHLEKRNSLGSILDTNQLQPLQVHKEPSPRTPHHTPSFQGRL